MTNPISIKEKKCENCGKEFKTKRNTKRFCSQRCQLGKWMDEHPRSKPDMGPKKEKEAQ